MMNRLLVTAGALFACYAGLMLLVRLGVPAYDVLWYLGLGWWPYLAEVRPRVKIAWDGVATGAVCLALFVLGMHRFLSWLSREIQVAAGRPHRPWLPRWTISLVTLIVVMFVLGISVTGIVHQTGWLIASRKGFLERKTVFPRDFVGESAGFNLRRIGDALRESSSQISVLIVERDARGRMLHSWQKEILGGMYFYPGEIHDDLPWDHPENSAYFKGIVPAYLSPEIGVIRSSEGYALSHFAGNSHLLDGKHPQARWDSKGQNTIVAGEVGEGFKPWGDPSNLRDPSLGINQVAGGFGGPSGLGANFLFQDGSVRFLRNTTAPEVLRRLGDPESQ
ncbi:DUF1559 domain-containing protein [Singulisphaera rosea]